MGKGTYKERRHFIIIARFDHTWRTHHNLVNLARIEWKKAGDQVRSDDKLFESGTSSNKKVSLADWRILINSSNEVWEDHGRVNRVRPAAHFQMPRNALVCRGIGRLRLNVRFSDHIKRLFPDSDSQRALALTQPLCCSFIYMLSWMLQKYTVEDLPWIILRKSLIGSAISVNGLAW